MSGSIDETKAIQEALSIVRQLRKLPIDTDNLADELVELSKVSAETNSAADANIRRDILQFAKEADQFLHQKSQGDKQLSGAGAKAAYQSKVFKCLGDYDSCRKRYGATLCGALCVICIGQQLIPFASKG